MSRYAPRIQLLTRSLRPATPALRVPLRARSFATKVETTTPTAPESAVAAAQPTGAATSTESKTAAAASASAAAQPNPKKLPYIVERNTFNNLSVYHTAKRGGNLKQTIVKKVDGDLQAFKRDLIEALRLESDAVAINGVTKHLVIKGHVKNQVNVYLGTCGF